VDRDRDGFGAGCAAGPDCLDEDPNVYPGALEQCGDGVDNDCSGAIDDRAACQPCSPDCIEGDTRCEGEALVRCVSDEARCGRWGTPESCGQGQSCFEGACDATCPDLDGDGFSGRCADSQGRVDCDDSRAASSPASPELCDGRDNNCDRFVDEGGVCGGCDDACREGEVACDGGAVVRCESIGGGCFGWGEPTGCPAGQGCVDGACSSSPGGCTDPDSDGAGPGCAATLDCRPLDAASRPGAAEACDGVDNNCDGTVDGTCAGCASATAAAPLDGRQGGGTLSGCDAGSYVTLPSGGVVTVVALADRGAVTLTYGSLTGGRFAPAAVAASAVVTLERGAALRSSAPAGAGAAVKVVATSGASVAVATAVHAGGVCSGDAAEPNNAPSAAAPTGGGAFAFEGRLCEELNDFFSIPAATAAQVVWTVTATGPGQDVALETWSRGVRRQGFVVAAQDGRPWLRQTWERVEDGPSSPVAVRNALAASQADRYALASVTLPTPACSDTESGAGDDLTENAPALARGATARGNLCAGDIDLVRLGTLTRGTQLSASATVSGADLDVYLLRDGWSGVVISGTDERLEQPLDINISADGVYYIAFVGHTPLAQGTWSATWR
jgi:hypothetical protein